MQPTDHLITKRRRSAFHDTGLDTLLRDLGVTQVVLAGISTSSGVESTARSASDHGYHVVLATDAMTDPDADAHRHSVERIFPKLGETATTAEITRHGGGDPMTLLGRLLHNRRAGETHIAWNLPNLNGPDSLTVTSRHFGDGEPMPLEHCAKPIGGGDLSPHLAWTPPPPGTAQLLLVVEDIDVPMTKPAVHCLALIDPAVGYLGTRRPGREDSPVPGCGCCGPPSAAATTVPHRSRATGRTGTSSSCSPSNARWTARRHRTGPDPAPSCPPSPHRSWAAVD